MHITFARLTGCAAIAAVIFLTACGGGSGGDSGGGSSTPTPGGGTPTTPTDPTPVDPVPPVATGSLTRTVSTSTPAACSIEQRLGGFTDGTLEIKDATWLQVVGQKVDDSAMRPSDKTLLVAGKEARIRVDVTAATAGTALPIEAKLQLAVTTPHGVTCEEIPLVSASAEAPTSVDYRVLDMSYVGVIQADKLKEGTISYQIVVHAADSTAADKLYRKGTVVVSPRITDKVVIYPIIFDGQIGSLPSTTEIKRLILRTMPHADVTVTVVPSITLPTLTKANGVDHGSYYLFTGSKMQDALWELRAKCDNDYPLSSYSYEVAPGHWVSVDDANKKEKCFGIFPSNVAFDAGAGMALQSGRVLLTRGFSATDVTLSDPYAGAWLAPSALSLVHEYGHVLSLGHAKCGTTDYLDNWWGTYRLYDDGRLGPVGMGFDTRDGVTPYYFHAGSKADWFADFMSYCGYMWWMSDRGHRAIIDYLGYYDGDAPDGWHP